MLIGVIAITLRFAPQEIKFALLTPIIILWLPLIDTILLMIFRIKKGKSPFVKSNDHISLRMSAFGFSHKKTIIFMFLLCFGFALAGIILTQVSNLAAVGILLTVFLCTVALFYKLVKVDYESK